MMWQRLWRDQRGAVAVLLAASLPALVAFAGLGVETGLWYSIKWQNQAAVDNAAYSAGLELAANKSCPDYSKLAVYGAGKNAGSGFPTTALATAFNSCTGSNSNCQTSGSYTMCVNNPPATGPNAGKSTYVEVTLSQTVTPMLAALDLPSLTIGSRAVANTAGGKACVLAVDSSASGAVSLANSATVEFSDCWVAADSTSATSISSSSATLCAYDIAYGAASGSGPSTTTVSDCSSPSTGISIIHTPVLASTTSLAGPTVSATLPSGANCTVFSAISLVKNITDSTHLRVQLSRGSSLSSGMYVEDTTTASAIASGTTLTAASAHGNGGQWDIVLSQAAPTIGGSDTIQFRLNSFTAGTVYCAPVGLVDGSWTLNGTYYIYGEGGNGNGYLHKGTSLSGVGFYAGATANITTAAGGAVTFILFGDASSNGGSFDINCTFPFTGTGRMSLTSPANSATAPLGGNIPAGVLFYQGGTSDTSTAANGSTSCPTTGNNQANSNSIVFGTGSNTVTLSNRAIIDSPNMEFDFSGTSTICTILIADKVTFGRATGTTSLSYSLLNDCGNIIPPSVSLTALAE